MRRGNIRGFTLIELMIAVAIVAILAAIAYPSYSRYGYRARRTEGQNFVAQIAAEEERYYTNFNTYSANVIGNPPAGLGFASANSLPNGYYAVTGGLVTLTNGGQGFNVTATPQGIQAGDSSWCPGLTIDNSGNETPTAMTSNGSCW